MDLMFKYFFFLLANISQFIIVAVMISDVSITDDQ